MSEIEIPFSREMAIAALDGYKIATTRNEPKGEIGDTFSIIDPREDHILTTGGEFRLIEIRLTNLETVKFQHYRLEGAETPAHFEEIWRALHRGHFKPDKDVYIHFFGRVV